MTHCHPGAEGAEEVPETAPASTQRRSEARLAILAVFALTGLVALGAVGGYFLPVAGVERTLPEGASVFFNAACGDCGPYMDMELEPALGAEGIPVAAVYDYVNMPSHRAHLYDLSENLGIPYSLRGHLMVFVKTEGRLLVLSGHVPGALIRDALANAPSPPYPRMLLRVSDSEMMEVSSYSAWAFTGAPATRGVQEPLATYLSTVPASGTGERSASEVLLPLVIAGGFVDGLNPCAFAVLLFFLAFLYVTRRPRTEVLAVGGIFIYAIYAVYFLIGIGLLGAFVISGDPHLMAKVGSALLVFLGGLTLLNAVVPAIPMPFKMSGRTWERVKPWMQRATIPAAGISGLLVGLCTFPCSGGIYVAIVGLIASHTGYVEGLGYLLLYNVMFVLPLLIILAVVSNRLLARRMAGWERAHHREVRILAGVGMIVLAVLVLLAV
jgi:cytochrome c biogenesis protein CcdA